MHRTRHARPLAAALALVTLAAQAAPASAESAPAPEDPEVLSTVEDLSAPPTAAEEAARETAREELAAQAAADDFYTPPAAVPAAPGTLLGSEPTAFYLDPTRLVQVPAEATRIMYSSQDSHGAPIPVTGTVLTPTAAWAGPGERPVIAYAPGTQGAADRCAPSRTLSTGEQYEGIGVTALLSRGYTVVVTDYEGLGTPGEHTYMVRESQAHTVLDSVRAAAELPGSGVSASSPVALAGYSQGGGASGAAAELAAQYAPELDVRAAYAGAPPADLTQVADRIDGGPHTAFLLFAMNGMLADAGIDPQSRLNDAGMAVLADAADSCTSDAGAFAGTDSSTLTDSGLDFPGLIRQDAELAGIVAAQTLGADSRAPDMPVMIAHSLTDDVIPYRTGRDLGRRWCAADARVRFDPLLTPTHMGGYVAALPRMTAFLDDAFDGRTTTDSCGWF